MLKQDLIGTWRLISVEARDQGGDVIESYGKQPVGLLMYGEEGLMSVVLMRVGRPRFAANDLTVATPEEIRSAFFGFDAYCASYTVDEEKSTVTHHILGCRHPNWEGTDKVRTATREGSRLHLVTPPIFYQNTEWELYLTFERASAS